MECFRINGRIRNSNNVVSIQPHKLFIEDPKINLHSVGKQKQQTKAKKIKGISYNSNKDYENVTSKQQPLVQTHITRSFQIKLKLLL